MFYVFGRPFIIPYKLILNFILSQLTQDKILLFIWAHFIHNSKTICFGKLIFFNWYSANNCIIDVYNFST